MAGTASRQGVSATGLCSMDLSSATVRSTHDFLCHVTNIHGYSGHQVRLLESAMRWSPEMGQPSLRTIEIRGLIKHDVTHFVDMSTTRWGFQYTLHKRRLLETINRRDSGVEQALSPFMLEMAELDLHAGLLETCDTHVVDIQSVRLDLAHEESFGVVPILQLEGKEGRHHTVPMGLMSLLEAHAIANEYLSMLSDMQWVTDRIRLRLDMQEFERRFDAMLAAPDGLLWSAPLHLARILLPWLRWEEQLRMVDALVRFALDAPDLALVRMAEGYRRRFDNPALGDCVCSELRRGRQLPVVYVMSLIAIHQLFEESDAAGRDALLLRMRKLPHSTVPYLLTTAFGVDPYALDPAWFDEVRAQLIAAEPMGPEQRILQKSLEVNAPLVAARSAGELPFQRLALMDMVLDDGAIVRPPRRIDLDVWRHVDESVAAMARIGAIHRMHRRMHVPASAAVALPA